MHRTPESVSYEISGSTGLIALNNPPVNAASHHLRAGLLAAFQALDADPNVKAIAIYGATKAFIAGADIREFGKPPQDPILPDVCVALEASAKPVIAVIHGPTLGGGLEVAISAHARVARPDLITGFPEVTLGVIPGAGGTQRAPRLIGIPATLELATTGRRIGAEEALRLGLVDRIAEGDPRDIALTAAKDALSGALPIRRTSDLTTKPDPTALDQTTEDLRALQSHLFAPHKVVEAVRLSTGPLPEGLAAERALFFECIDSPQRAGLIHAFFSERAVTKIPEAGATPCDIQTTGVVGGGTMGSGIATALLLASLPVTLVERDTETAEKTLATITTNLDSALKRGKITAEKRAKADLTVTTDFAALADKDLVIEAIFEDMALKQDIFRRLDATCKPGAILATNTSYLDVNAIAAATNRPQDVLGLHFFSPAHIMRLLEVVVADQTAPEVTATGFALARRLKNVAVRAGVCDGFIGNRILRHYRQAVDHLHINGAPAEQIDRAMEGFGFAMGPLAVSDLAGLDIGWAMRKRLAPNRDPNERYITVADRLCENSWFGRKTGRGYYLYEGNTRQPNPDLAAIVAAEQQAHGITPREFSDQEITDRILTAMISEASRVLEDGIALRPIDIDAVLLFGYGFPRHHGGPLHHADTIGAATLIQRIETYAQEDPYYWQVPALLRDMAKTGQTFADINKEHADGS